MTQTTGVHDIGEHGFDEIQELLVSRLSKDLRDAAKTMSRDEAKYIVDTYYDIQHNRIGIGNRISSLKKREKPVSLMSFLSKHLEQLEARIPSVMRLWTEEQKAGEWALSVCGIGPVIAAGILSQIDIERAPYSGHLLSFAGLIVGQEWLPHEQRPWNANLKTLVVFKAGESFVKVQGNKNDFYGKIYRGRKDREVMMNEEGKFSDLAKKILSKKDYSRHETVARAAYEQGKLPAAHLHARARRMAAKFFLTHLHHVLYEETYGVLPAQPYVLDPDHMGHVGYLPPPNHVCIGGDHPYKMPNIRPEDVH